ncbi:MAG: GerMN domain-containing protein [Candidatus Eisenbacteria bacterium]
MRGILLFVRRALTLLGKSLLILGVVVVVLAAGIIGWFRNRAARERPPATVAGDVVVPRGTRAIELWFADARGASLMLETREVVADAVEGDALVRTVVGEYLRGPERGEARAAFPEGVSLAHVYRDPAGGLYLDFGPELRRAFQGGSSAEVLLVSSLLRTVAANVPGVSRVTLTAGGQPIVTLGGHVRLDGPLVVSEWR